MLLNQLIVEQNSAPCVVNPLSVSINSTGKKRLILDLRYVNKFLWKEKIRFEDWKVALEYFRKGVFMISFDLKAGYHHIEIFPEHSQFLSFSWEFDGCTRYFSFQVLPFGLSTAPYIFTKCLRPLVKYWRSKGVCMVLYLDDSWICTRSKSECLCVSKAVKSDILAAGLVPNKEKSVWVPSPRIVWLGLSWDAQEGSIQVTERRISDILNTIADIQNYLPFVTARRLASLAGKLISLSPVVGLITQLKSRFLHYEIIKQYHWD